MYAYIKGKVEYKHADCIIVEANGIGYCIKAPVSALEAAGEPGTETKLYTHLYVREDEMSLYGFLTLEELYMFELLITVSGVGPKAAISLVSAISPSKFGLSVITGDYKTLTKAQGIGSKIAQRIILELKDKIKKEQLAWEEDVCEGQLFAGMEGGRFKEAANALMVLGYSASEANRAVAKVYSENMELEEIIRRSLKGLIR